ncbi:hypothetical protein AOZ06_25165 [Kibdelosporangium phytohabitans]|uniref:Uncharacterized protein n=1 Tax=Kibdelosporangium phytohabitans TaxID=860235 RepID=A0A0N7F3W3_9PSEU|nr:hypothetical protein AOZ06_25165 [Kibdelosporangium phytohabitans]
MSTRFGVAEQQLFDTAPQTESTVRVADQRVRGDWTTVDVVDESGRSVLPGILERPLPRDLSDTITGATTSGPPMSGRWTGLLPRPSG